MKHLSRIITLAAAVLLTAGWSAQAAFPEAGKAYRLTNAQYTTLSLTSNGPVTDATANANAADALSQEWLVEDAGGGAFHLRCINDGLYLHSPFTIFTGWTMVETPDANCTFTATASDGGTYMIGGSTDNSGAPYLFVTDEGGRMFSWIAGDKAAMWKVTPSKLTAEQIAEALKNAESMRDQTGDATKLQAALNALFADKACTTLAAPYATMTPAQLQADANYQALPDPLRTMVMKVRNANWAEAEWDSAHARKFRVQSYEPYSRGAEYEAAGLIGVQAYTNMNNPTGIIADNQDVLYIMVDGAPKDGSTLYIGSVTGTGMFNDYDHGTALHEGLNIVPVWTDNAAQYIYYTVDTYSNGARRHKLADYPALTIHIEGGDVNGFFNYIGDELYTPDTNTDWAYYRDRARHEMFDLVGQYVILHFHLYDRTGGSMPSLRTVLSAGKKFDLTVTMKAWDDMCFAERLLMGIQSDKDILSDRAKGCYAPLTGDDVAPSDLHEYFNNRMMGITIETEGNMNATSWRTAYPPSTMQGILLNLPDNPGDLWGPAHEYGHINQQPMKIAGTTEVSNNVFSNVAVYYQGISTSRAAYPSDQRDVFNRGLTYLEHGTWGTTRMFWQLWSYYHATGHNKKFYPRLYELLRRNPLTQSYNLNPRYDMLHFAKMCCIAAGEDLTEFFTAWGFFVPQTNYAINDYATYVSNLTQADINAVKAEIAALGLPQNHAILFIDDRVGSDRRSYTADYDKTKCGSMGGFSDYINGSTPSADYRYSLSGTTLTLTGGTGGVGFAVYDDATGALIGFGNDTSFELSHEAAALLAAGKATVKAVGSDNSLLAVPDVMADGTTEQQRQMLGALLDSVSRLLQLTTEGDVRVGWYRNDALTALRAAYADARRAYDGADSASYASAYAALSAEYMAVTGAADAKVAIDPDATYFITNVNYPTLALAASGKACTTTAKITAGNTSCHWQLTPSGADTYTLFNAATGSYVGTTSQHYVDVPLSATATPYLLREMTDGVYALASGGDSSNALHVDAAHKVVMWLDSETPSHWTITMATPPSGIEEIGTDATCGPDVIYDLTGRRVSAITAPGIYIVNGKKLLIH